MTGATTSRRVEATFNDHDPQLVCNFVSAVVDLGLSRAGATMAEIESADLALEALIETASAEADITGLVVDFDGKDTIVELLFDAPVPAIEADLRIYGFASIIQAGNELTAVVDPGAAA